MIRFIIGILDYVQADVVIDECQVWWQRGSSVEIMEYGVLGEAFVSDSECIEFSGKSFQ